MPRFRVFRYGRTITLPIAWRSVSAFSAAARFGQRIDLVDVARQLALGGPVRELVERGAIGFRLEAHPIAEIDADDGAALQQRQIERQLGNLAGGKADHEMPAFPGDRAQRGFAIGAADRIEDDVDAVLAAELLQRVRRSCVA